MMVIYFCKKRGAIVSTTCSDIVLINKVIKWQIYKENDNSWRLAGP